MQAHIADTACTGLAARRDHWPALAEQALQAARSAGLLRRQSYIDGAWVDGADVRPVLDPATGQALVDVQWCAPEAVAAAVDAGQRAFGAWRGLLPAQRGSLLRDWAALMRENRDPLARIVVLEQGKPLAEAVGEIDYAAGFLDWFAAEGERACGQTIPGHKAQSRLTVDMEPVGVTGIITPWNFPSAMITRKAAAALAAGCTTVVKPAPETPLSALALAALAERAGFPPGAFNVVVGDARTLTEPLLRDARVRAVSFTGSTEVGRLILAQAAGTVKRTSMELGGHAPCVVFDDANLDIAVPAAVAAKYATSGQDCLAANRIYVQRGVHDRFCDAYVRAVSAMRIGHGLEAGVAVGPMTRASVKAKCLAHIDDARSRGASVLCGGGSDGLGGNFVAPTVLAGVTEDMLIAREETFGPVAAILLFDDEQEVVARANRSEMGLAAYVFTEGLNRATRVTQALEYGMVGVNTASFTGAPIPFGGYKQSGLGREGSQHGIAEFMELKYVCFGNLAA